MAGPPDAAAPAHYRAAWRDGHGAQHQRIDPYSFAPTIGEADLTRVQRRPRCRAPGACSARTRLQVDGIAGVRFAVWAPNAERVSVVGPFCDWDGRRLPMRVLGCERRVGTVHPGPRRRRALQVRNPQPRQRRGGAEDRPLRARRPNCARPPHRSSRDSRHAWGDATGCSARAQRDWLHAPMSHLRSARRLLAAPCRWRFLQLPRAGRRS